MEFAEQIKYFASKIPEVSKCIQTEEATKTALIMPFLNILGYNVFDPTLVVPEFTADHGTKKGEKVDYAIMNEGKPIILIECKGISDELNNNQASQLFRYFSVTEAKVGILTNGITYRFFSDLDSPNKMDEKPFLEINMLNLKESDINEIKRFSQEAYDPEGLTSVAIKLKYTKEIISILEEELNSPSDEFVKFFARKVYNGHLKKSVMDRFRFIVKDARNKFINEKINERLKSAMKDSQLQEAEGDEQSDDNGGVVTSVEEFEGFYIVRGILRNVVESNRVAMRDTKSYCGIILDDNNRKPICRLYFNSKQKYIGLFDENKKEQKNPINDLADIYDHADHLRKTITFYNKK